MKDRLTTNVHSEQVSPPDAKHVLSAVASIEQIEEVARQYFEVKYPSNSKDAKRRRFNNKRA